MRYLRKGCTLLILMVIIFSCPLGAQNQARFGVKGGLNFANFTGADVDPGVNENNVDFESRTGFVIGGWVEFPVSEIFSVQPELYYSMKGATDKEKEGDQTIKISFLFNYLELPVLFKIKIPVEGTVHPNLFLGPFFAFKMKGDFKIEVEDQSLTTKLEDLKSTDYGLVFGGGIDFDLGGRRLNIEARYNMGFAKIFPAEDGETPDIKNKVISLMVGYGF